MIIAILEKVRKSMLKGAQKSSKLVQNAPRGRPGSIDRAIWDDFGRGRKSMIFKVAPGHPKIKENREMARKVRNGITGSLGLKGETSALGRCQNCK